MEKRMLYALVAIVVVVAIVGGVTAYVILSAPPAAPKYSIELWYNNDGHYGDTEADLAQTLQQSVQACGNIQVTLKSDTWAVYKQNWASGRMPMFLLGWYPDYFDTDDYISPFLSTSGAKSEGSFYSNATVDQWILEEQSTTDASVRADRFAKIQTALANDVVYIPLFSGRADVAYVNSVSNVVLHPVVFKWFVVGKTGASQINVSTSDKIITLDPASAYDYFSIEIINQVFDTLLVYDWQTNDLKPGLATTIPTVANGGVSADGMTYTYHLRQGVTFSDGSAFNASVVKRSIDRAIRMDLAGSAAFLLYDVGALGRSAANGNNTAPGVITTPDDYTVVFHLQRPVSFFNELMAFSVSAPVPWTYSQTGEQPSTVGSVIGTGPYVMTQHTENTLVVLQARSGYYNSALYAPAIPSIPVTPKIAINIRSTATALKQDITTKAVDVVYRTFAPTDLTDLQTNAASLGITVHVGASPQIRFLVFQVNANTTNNIPIGITDVRVRQAIAYAVDRAQINSVVFNGLVTPLYSMVPSNMPYASPVFQPAYGDHNCAASNNLISQVPLVVGFHPASIVARDE